MFSGQRFDSEHDEREIKRIEVDAKEIRDVQVTQDDGRAVVYVNGVKVREFPAVEEREIVEIVDSQGVRQGVFVRDGKGTVRVRSGDHVDFDELVRSMGSGEGAGFFSAVRPLEDAPPVMIGITMSSPAPGHLLEGTGLHRDEVTYITDVIEGLPAHEAGLRKGDVIVKIDDADSGDADTLRSVLRTKSPGDTLKVTVLRDGQRNEFLLGLKAYEREALSGGNSGPVSKSASWTPATDRSSKRSNSSRRSSPSWARR